MKKVSIALLALVTVALVAIVITPLGAAGETSAPSCNGNCGVEGCAAAQGGACDCEVCPAVTCENGNCGGACSNNACGAKIGSSCDCGN